MELVCYNNNGCTNELTLYKKYEIITTLGAYLYVINDQKILAGFHRDRFITIDEWRNKQLNKLIGYFLIINGII